MVFSLKFWSKGSEISLKRAFPGPFGSIGDGSDKLQIRHGGWNATPAGCESEQSDGSLLATLVHLRTMNEHRPAMRRHRRSVNC